MPNANIHQPNRRQEWGILALVIFTYLYCQY
jgi:hypothetical protein